MSQAAARLNDPIAHTPLLGSILKMAGQLAAGLAVGALAGAAAAAIVGTGGVGAIVVGAVISSLLMAAGGNSLVEAISGAIDDAVDAFFPAEITGIVSTTGSPDVSINDLPAAIAAQEIANNIVCCSKYRHYPMPLQYVAEGSDSVFINDSPAHRVGDRTTCDAKTHSGSSNVFIGGDTLTVRPITPETPAWLQWAGVAIGIATALCTRNWKSIPGKLACLGVSMGIGFAADAAVGAVIGHPVHAGSGAKILDGADDTDFALPAHLPLEWTRCYNSLDLHAGLLGQGWRTPVCLQLKLHQPGEYPNLFIDLQGREIPFEALAPGQSQNNTAEDYRLNCTVGGHYIVETGDGEHFYDFGPARQDGAHTLDLLGLEDRNGNALTLLRDAAGRLTDIGDSAGRHYRCHYDTAHPERLAGIELAPDDSHEAAEPDWLVRYAYDGQGRLIAVTDRGSVVTRRFTWCDDGAGVNLMASHSLPDGLTAHYRWEAFADHPRVTEHWDDAGNRWRIDYTVTGFTRATDHLGRTQQWQWDKRYALLAHTNAAGETWTFARDADGRLVSATQPNGGQWRFQYDARGNLAEQTDPAGALTRIDWRTDWALPKVETDALGERTEYCYDELGNLIERHDRAGATVWTLDRYGQPLLRTDAKGATARWGWNDAGQIVAATDCSGHVTRAEYDRDGHLVALIDPLGERTDYCHDRQGRLIEAHLPDDTTRQWRWNAAGRLTRLIDGQGGETLWQWERGRPARRIDAAGRIVDYLYDAGELAAVVNENEEAYRFGRDAVGRIVAQTGLDGRRTAFTLDALGLPIEVREAAGTPAEIRTTLERDLLGRLAKKTTRESITAYTRDARGQLTHIARTTRGGEPIDEIGFAYDGLGNLITETQTVHRRLLFPPSTTQQTITHQYDALGNRTATTLPDGRTLQFLHYGSGHL
ncbi:MAG: DUF6531 domain-containing protein, partial [Azoarcus sp.]|nr:DUF6531 domain-containing protein [Azoarcus sp.]